MSSRADELIWKAERGGRVRELREATGMTQGAFVEKLKEQARAFGYALDLDDDTKLSRVEGGTRNLGAEEAVLIWRLAAEKVSAEKRTIEWLVFGPAAAAGAAKDRSGMRRPMGRGAAARNERTGT